MLLFYSKSLEILAELSAGFIDEKPVEKPGSLLSPVSKNVPGMEWFSVGRGGMICVDETVLDERMMKKGLFMLFSCLGLPEIDLFPPKVNTPPSTFSKYGKNGKWSTAIQVSERFLAADRIPRIILEKDPRASQKENKANLDRLVEQLWARPVSEIGISGFGWFSFSNPRILLPTSFKTVCIGGNVDDFGQLVLSDAWRRANDGMAPVSFPQGIPGDPDKWRGPVLNKVGMYLLSPSLAQETER